MIKNNDILLNVDNLNMRFGGIIALKGVNLSVLNHSITALIGPNGAGKTTLFNCLTGFYQATEGKLLLNIENKQISLSQIMGENFKIKHLIHPIEALTVLYYKMFGGSHMVARSGIARTFQNIRLLEEGSPFSFSGLIRNHPKFESRWNEAMEHFLEHCKTSGFDDGGLLKEYQEKNARVKKFVKDKPNKYTPLNSHHKEKNKRSRTRKEKTSEKAVKGVARNAI